MNSSDLKIFMAEDNEFFAIMIAAAIKDQYGFNIDVFHTGEDMLKRMHESPDIILLDFQLNSENENCMNGDEVLKNIKRINPDTKVVMISSQKDLEMAIELLKFGACNYICKDLHSVKNIGITLQNLQELINLKTEVKFYKSKSTKEKYRLAWLSALVFFGLITSYFLG